ncbi:MAG: hypothetical protein MUF76_03825 [Hydrogenophaga sp.]|jgi:hypothetical protein|nr:hypothetical protein [Hydrogenophaga sp.]
MQLIDHYLPQWQFAERHELVLPGVSPEQAFAAVVPGLSAPDPLIERAIALREGPGRLLRRLGMGGVALPSRGFGFHSFTPLGSLPDREVAFGLAGQFWRLDYGLQTVSDATAFERLQDQPKLVLNVCVEPVAGGCRLVTHTRVYCPSETLRRRFAPYWTLIRPVSGLIRRRLLKAVARASQPALQHR